MPLRRRPAPVPHRAWAVLTRHEARARAEEIGQSDDARFAPYVAQRPAGRGDREPLTDDGPSDGGRHRPTDSRPRWIGVPAVLREARGAVSGAALVGVLAIVVAVALVLGIKVAWADTGVTRPEAAPSVQLTTASPGASGSVDPAPSPSASNSAASVVVDVVGQVATPGIVRLPTGSRVTDAVAAAGGPLPGADIARVNLARVVVDGEQIRIPAPGEELPVATGSGTGSTTASSGPAGLVNLNTADLASLDTLPGVGPVLAGRILEWRSAHGRFTSVDELGEVSGIGERLLEQLRSRVTV